MMYTNVYDLYPYETCVEQPSPLSLRFKKGQEQNDFRHVIWMKSASAPHSLEIAFKLA